MDHFAEALRWRTWPFAVKRLDVNLGDLVEIDGRTCDVVSDTAGGVASAGTRSDAGSGETH
jgi:hypothetical protein